MMTDWTKRCMTCELKDCLNLDHSTGYTSFTTKTVTSRFICTEKMTYGVEH